MRIDISKRQFNVYRKAFSKIGAGWEMLYRFFISEGYSANSSVKKANNLIANVLRRGSFGYRIKSK